MASERQKYPSFPQHVCAPFDAWSELKLRDLNHNI